MALKACADGGRVVLVGMGQEEMTLPLTEACIREVDICGSFRWVGPCGSMRVLQGIQCCLHGAPRCLAIRASFPPSPGCLQVRKHVPAVHQPAGFGTRQRQAAHHPQARAMAGSCSCSAAHCVLQRRTPHAHARSDSAGQARMHCRVGFTAADVQRGFETAHLADQTGAVKCMFNLG